MLFSGLISVLLTGSCPQSPSSALSGLNIGPLCPAPAALMAGFGRNDGTTTYYGTQPRAPLGTAEPIRPQTYTAPFLAPLSTRHDSINAKIIGRFGDVTVILDRAHRYHALPSPASTFRLNQPKTGAAMQNGMTIVRHRMAIGPLLHLIHKHGLASDNQTIVAPVRHGSSPLLYKKKREFPP